MTLSEPMPCVHVLCKKSVKKETTGPSHNFSLIDLPFFLFIIPTLKISSNLSSVKHNLSSTGIFLNILLLSKTQLSNDVLTSPFFISFYNFHSYFCAYSINTSVTSLKDLKSPNSDVIWLKVCSSTNTIFLCFANCFPNSMRFQYPPLGMVEFFPYG